MMGWNMDGFLSTMSGAQDPITIYNLKVPPPPGPPGIRMPRCALTATKRNKWKQEGKRSPTAWRAGIALVINDLSNPPRFTLNQRAVGSTPPSLARRDPVTFRA